MKPFVVLALPRSRTAWVANYLSYGGWDCGHEELRHVRGFDDIESWFAQPMTGTVETAGAPWWRLLGDVNVAVIRRPVADVVRSFANASGFAPETLWPIMQKLDRKLDQVTARLPNVVSVTFDELATEEGCARLFEHCLPFDHDPEHFARWASVNVQIDLSALVRYANAYRPQMTKMVAMAWQKSLVALQSRTPVNPEGITFAEESFDSWLEGAQPLFRNHLVLVGESPDNWKNKNIPLMRKMYDANAMQIVTARSNGRMFGYLATIIGPSLVSEGMITASSATFYADPSFPGLGMKLQRASLAKLKAKGVKEVFYEAGHRGSGPRLGAMYRRLGAVEHGQAYRLPLEA